MTGRETLIGFLALLGAIVILSAIGAWTGEPADIAVMTGLIGLGGALIPRRSNPPTDNSQGSN